MAPDIGNLVSQVFYEGKLENGTGPAPHFYNDGPQFIKSNVTWVDTSSLGKKSYHQSDRGVSIYNRCEADLVIKMLKDLYTDLVLVSKLKDLVGKGEPAIGVICMYAEQKRLIAQKFNESVWSDEFKSLVKIGTVDSYQGKENRIVILSVTNSSRDMSPRFLKSPNRINVALSRAMDRLVIVGSAEMWKGQNEKLPLGMVVSLMSSNSGHGRYDFISPDIISGVPSTLIAEKYAVGDKVVGKILGFNDYGFFIGLEGGIKGLVKMSQISWEITGHENLKTALRDYKKGDEVSAIILAKHPKKKEFSLSIKQGVPEDRWSSIKARYPNGHRVQATVTKLHNDYLLVSIELGIQGKVHASEMAWTNERIYPSNYSVTVGDTLEVMILDVDPEHRSISLSIKQCVDNPWANIGDEYVAGDEVVGNINKIGRFGIMVGLKDGINGIVYVSQLSQNSQRLESKAALRSYNLGDEVSVIILHVDSKKQHISLRIKQRETDLLSETDTLKVIEDNKEVK
jgi:predicted RNA-binding protein with RPS1 domain